MVQNKSIGSRSFDILLLLFMAVVSILSIAPIVHTIALSFSKASLAAAGQVFLWPKGFNTGAYDQVFSDHQFFVSFGASVKRTFIYAALSLFVTVMMAYPLSRERKDFKSRNVYMWIFVFVMMFNAGLVPTYLTIKSLGMMNNFWVLVIPGLVNVYNAILVLNFFRNLPKELDESAGMDGAGAWRKLFQIYLPLSLPVLATITLFNIVNTWNEYFAAMIYVTKSSLIPLQTYLQQVVLTIDPTKVTTQNVGLLTQVSNETLSSAKIAVTMLPILLIYPVLQRYFITGITLGSVKE
ncbi:carbohydrate ABC transporter permease [Paenibacillus lycopersici]|uniref:Carbohydrate ABC transporter permease n=1 Tax=Paenibacillus lycopersici TaxID=2704462 RepID=A0A6C0FUI3_9BACL|nr:carbohydrate ABC transporter permease [Paenibacillus lycopersici]QHT60816.1 carbohydrate ABC transporter permease [Paenibacillus lycopersici]